MARKENAGTGITQTQRTMLDMTGETPGDIDRFHASLKNFNDTLTRNGGFFGMVTEGARKTCAEILVGWGDDWRGAEFETDSPEYFAREVAVLLESVQGHVERGEMDLALRWAFIAGRTWERALMKWRWEDDALRGVVTKKGASTGGASRAGRYAPDTEERQQIMAEFIASGHSISRAAGLTAQRGLGTVGANRKLWTRHRHRKLGHIPPLSQ